MRKMLLLVAMLAMALAVAAPAFAAVKRGDGGDNYIRETCGNDTLVGRGGNDTLDANNCGGDRDLLYGNRGNDRLLANDGDRLDSLNGGPGFDTCVVDAKSEVDGGCNRVLVRAPSS
jgi:Ca2+-binding RTX toxin-like protein